MCVVSVPGDQATQQKAWDPETRATDVFELPCRHWEPNPGSLQQQPELLTAEPALQNKPEPFVVVHTFNVGRGGAHL